MGTAISTEGRAWFNVAGNINNVPLTVWAPNINLHRNVLWGRSVETPGEDPVLNGEYAFEFIKAMQGNVTADDVRARCFIAARYTFLLCPSAI